MLKKILKGVPILFLSVVLLTACSGPANEAPKEEPVKEENVVDQEPARGILLSTTIGPVDAGIIDTLIDAYTKDNPEIAVRYLSRGTGTAIDLAKGGNVDMVIVHAKSLEEEFVAEGYGTERIDFMYNDFVLVGPEDDPAGAKDAASITEALALIRDGGHKFVSRGDRSGTHVKEMEIWEEAGFEPEGDWYDVYEKGNEGNKATLLYTNDEQAYTIIDRATVIANSEEISNLEVLYENDEIMLNYITIIPSNAEKLKGINQEDTAAFIEWLTGADAQEIIKDFGIEKFGEPLFFPNAA